MINLLLILIVFGYVQSSDVSNELIMKEFVPSGSIESLVDNTNDFYYIVQLDL